MSRLELIPYFNENIEKYKRCMSNYQTFFSKVERISKILELIPNVLGDFYSTPSIRRKK